MSTELYAAFLGAASGLVLLLLVFTTVLMRWIAGRWRIQERAEAALLFWMWLLVVAGGLHGFSVFLTWYRGGR